MKNFKNQEHSVTCLIKNLQIYWIQNHNPILIHRKIISLLEARHQGWQLVLSTSVILTKAIQRLSRAVHSVEASAVMEMFNMVAASHMQLLSTWYVSSAGLGLVHLILYYWLKVPHLVKSQSPPSALSSFQLLTSPPWPAGWTHNQASSRPSAPYFKAKVVLTVCDG